MPVLMGCYHTMCSFPVAPGPTGAADVAAARCACVHERRIESKDHGVVSDAGD